LKKTLGLDILFFSLFLELAFQASFTIACQKIRTRTVGAVYRLAMETMIRFDKREIFLVVHSQGRNRTNFVDLNGKHVVAYF